LNIQYPMTFEVIAPNGRTHCSVLEFTAPEGTCYLPYWMMSNLTLTEGTRIRIKNVSLPKATFVKFQPQHIDFLEITNPRAVLEFKLRSFSCVTKGDQLAFTYNDRKYYLEVKEVKPQDAACIIEADVNVDFDAPVGYKEPVRAPVAPPPPLLPETQKAIADVSGYGGVSGSAAFEAFGGVGARLDGKALKPSQMNPAESISPGAIDVDAEVCENHNCSIKRSSSGGGGGGDGSNHHWGEGAGSISTGNIARGRRQQALAAAEARMSSLSSVPPAALPPEGPRKKMGATKWSKQANKKFLSGTGHRLL
jgi:ubiquitin fusion degradation protein 1